MLASAELEQPPKFHLKLGLCREEHRFKMEARRQELRPETVCHALFNLTIQSVLEMAMAPRGAI